LALSERDRYLRFGYPASDAQIRRYADSLDFDRDDVFGVFNRKLEIVALAHVAYPDATLEAGHPAEFGGSVLPRLRGRGIGSRLFEHAVLEPAPSGTTVLTGPNGMTVYTLSSDPNGGSSCTGQCLTFWPALTVPAGGSVSAPSSEKGTLSTFVRTDDGTTQVALNGHALYYFVKDGAPGDVNGEGVTAFGGVWHAVKLSAGAVQGATGSPSATLPVTATDAGQGTSGTLLPLLLIALGGLTAVLFAARPIARTMRNR